MAETFTLLAASWDVAKALKLIGDREPSGTFNPATCKSYFGLIRINEEHAKTVDVKKPVVGVKVWADGVPSYLLIDGWHRAWRGVEDGVASMPIHILSEKEAKAVSLTAAAKKIVTAPKAKKKAA